MKVSHQATYAVLTAASAALTFLLMVYWPWSGGLTYISASISTLTVVKYIGTWQRNLWSIIYSSFWASVLGVITGFFWKMPVLQLFLIFCGICWINKCSIWNAMSKTFGGLIFLLGALLPVLTAGETTGWNLATVLILLAVVPALLAGVVLMLPPTRLAYFQCKTDILLLLNLICSITDAYVHAFCNPSESDLHLSVASRHMEYVQNLLKSIALLTTDVKTEAVLFRELIPFSLLLTRLLPLLMRLVDELADVHDSVPDLTANETHKMFVSALIGPLSNAATEIRVSLLQLVSGRIKSFNLRFFLFRKIRPLFRAARLRLRHMGNSIQNFAWCNTVSSTCCRIIGDLPFYCIRSISDFPHSDDSDDDHASVTCRRRSLGMEEEEGSEAILRLHECKEGVLQAMLFSREAYVFVHPPGSEAPLRQRHLSGGGDSEGSSCGGRVGTGIVSEYGEENMRESMYAAYCPPVTRQAIEDGLSSGITKSAILQLSSDDGGSAHSSVYNDVSTEDGLTMIKRSLSQEEGSSIQHGPPSPSATPPTSPSRNRLRTGSDATVTSALHKDMSIYMTPTRDVVSGVCSTKATVLYYENIRLGARNLVPRGACVCRYLVAMDTVGEILNVMWTPIDNEQLPVEFTGLFASIVDSVRSQAYYFYTCLYEPVLIAHHCFALFRYHTSRSFCGIGSSSDDIAESRSFVAGYIHPLKLSIITTTASLLVILPALHNVFPYALWGAVVVTLIRQENSASSYHKAFQRMEGTVVGCIFAYLASQWMGCDYEDCNHLLAIAVTVVWIAMCSYFRWSSKHGYAAVVAGFTPVVIILGPSRGSQDSAWGRVQMTFIGVAIYLIIDNLLVPDRSDDAVRHSAVGAIGFVRSALSTTSRAMSVLTTWSEFHEYDIEHPPKSGTANPVESSVESNSAPDTSKIAKRFTDLSRCSQDTDDALQKLGQSIDLQRALLELVVHEPHVLHRPFPLAVYTKLLQCLERVASSSRALSNAMAAIGISIDNMAHEETVANLTALHAMNKHLREVFVLAEHALECESSFLNRVFEARHEGMHLDDGAASDALTAIITLSRMAEVHLTGIDEEYRFYYFKQTNGPRSSRTKLNIDFVTHWQNACFSAIQHVKNLSALGIALHNVRHAESTTHD